MAWFYNCLKALNIKLRPMYNTRHTYASCLISSGMVPESYVAEQMGHSVDTLRRHYGILLDEAKAKQHVKLNAIFADEEKVADTKAA